MPQAPFSVPDRRAQGATDNRYDPATLDALSFRHASLQRDLGSMRTDLAERSVATVLEQLASFDLQLRGFVATHDSVLLQPLSRDWRRDERIVDRIARSREQWQGLVATFETLARDLAAIDLQDAPALVALDFRFAEASHHLGEAFRSDRASLFLLFLAPNRAPDRTH
ncbi:MAG TPA: hypothetical protein VND91_01045 [Candidatus Saccharimonadia bacterium]|nr:hypothetical protein [Candidatus Saccharimonadia bacterium]